MFHITGPAKADMSVTIGKAKAVDSTGIERPANITLTSPAYTAGAYGTQELSAWHPRLASADSEVLPVRDKIVARSRNLRNNNGWADGGVEKRTDAVVGANTWLRAKPDFAAMGLSAEWAAEFAMRVESLFRTWANSSRFLCDVERHHHFGGLVRLAYQHYIIDGEATAPIMWLPERGGMFATSVLVMDPDRLSTPSGRHDDQFMRMGVELDRYGAAQAYHCRNSHVSDIRTDFEASNWTRIPRETNTGRPLFVHVYDKKRAHMRRGLGRFTSVMSRMKMLDRYDQTELQAAITNAIFGLYAKTQRSSDDVRDSMAPVGDDELDSYEVLDGHRADFYDSADLTFDGVRVAVMPAGDELGTISANRPATNFKVAQRVFLNSVASALGISGEQLSNDWEGINYSSARTLLNEIWRGLNADRRLFTQSFCTPIYAAFLEEAVARDLVEVPGGQAMFYVWRDALTQCDWVGPGRGTIDPKKEADAGAINRGLFVSTLESDCAEQGTDWRTNLWQAKREQEEMKAYGLTPVQPNAPAGGTGDAGGGDDEADAPAAQGAREE
jgi:lambda family phage portal protein